MGSVGSAECGVRSAESEGDGREAMGERLRQLKEFGQTPFATAVAARAPSLALAAVEIPAATAWKIQEQV